MEDIKQNYIAWTLLGVSFILPFIDMKSAIVVNLLAIIAFMCSKGIANFIIKERDQQNKVQEFYDAVKKYQNNFLVNKNLK